MASFLPSYPITLSLCRRRHRHYLPRRGIGNKLTFHSTNSSTPIDSYISTPLQSRSNYFPGLCHAAVSPPEPPPEKNESSSSSGVLATFTRFKDTLQVFFAVLFWMSLFFWSCAWDGGNSGRPNKRTRNRK